MDVLYKEVSLYLFLALKWAGPNLCDSVSPPSWLLFWSFSKRKINESNKQYNELIVKNKHS